MLRRPPVSSFAALASVSGGGDCTKNGPNSFYPELRGLDVLNRDGRTIPEAIGRRKSEMPRNALVAAGIPEQDIYGDRASGKKDDRPGLEACLKVLRT
jgi:hypothetical protein